MYQKYIEELRELNARNNLRKLPGKVPGGLVNLSSNDYLGINEDQGFKKEFLSSGIMDKIDFSASSSRLLTGNSKEYEQLENAIARAYQKESCLIYNSGYHANTGILPTLTGIKDLILADKMVHASIIDGSILSKAEVKRYKHLDFAHLEELLRKNRDNYENVFIVTESVFSMDGGFADLSALVALKKKYNAFLYIDEAHALGVLGENGLGLSEEQGLVKEAEFIVGTFGKALASVGAFVVCNDIFKKYLVNKSRCLIFTTALPPVNLAWTHFIFDKLPILQKQRIHLKMLGNYVTDTLQVKAHSHIIPFILGSNAAAVKCAVQLQELGYYVMPIRHPTVPLGSARIRLSLHAGLEKYQLINLLKFLKGYGKNMDQ